MELIVRNAWLLLAATSLLMGCGSKTVSSTTPTQRSGDVAASPSKPQTVTTKSEKAETKAAKKSEKASEKSEKASEKKAEKLSHKSDKASEKSSKDVARTNAKTEKEVAKANAKSEKEAAKPSDKPVNAQMAPKAEQKDDQPTEKKSEKPHAAAHSPRQLTGVPPGHYPPSGQCRLWYSDRAPGQQPKATECHKIGKVPAGAFILFNNKGWDADYNWAAQEKREWGSVPGPVLEAMRGARR
jgi:hypothetical protein